MIVLTDGKESSVRRPSGLQIRKEKVEHFFTADCKSAGTPSGRQEDAVSTDLQSVV